MLHPCTRTSAQCTKLLLITALLLSVHALASSLPDAEAASNRLLRKRADLKQRLQTVSSNEDRLAALQGAYAGKRILPLPRADIGPCEPKCCRCLLFGFQSATRIQLFNIMPSGETCFIVACGPSLANVSSARIRRAVAGGVVLAVKQAAALLGAAADFHLVNVVNLQPMQHDAQHPPVVVFHTCACSRARAFVCPSLKS
jgi:hypothetical protein